MTIMKSKQESIRRKIFRYFAIFSLVILVFLWLFQIVFLKPFYQATITENLKSSATSIAANIESDDLYVLLKKCAMDYDLSLRLISIDDNTTDISASNKAFDNYLNSLHYFELYRIYEAAKETGEMKEVFYAKESIVDDYRPEMFDGQVPKMNMGKGDMILYARILEDSSGKGYLLIGTSQLTPVDPISNTLKIQLLFSSVLFLGLSALFTWFISEKISNPIIDINESAKTLATGNYDVKFKGEGYSEIKELSSTLNYAAGELKKVDSLQKELIANISHDLRTPLTMISGYAEMMRDIEEERTEDNLNIIVEETDRLSSLVNDVVDLSRYQSRSDVLNAEEFSMNELIRSTLSHYEKMYQNYYQFDYTADQETVVKADKLKISQVLYNLLNNAINYSVDSVKIEVVQKTENNRLSVSVTNYGKDISPEDLPYLFERYYRSKENHVRATSGSGLGLSIVKNIMTLHNGSCFAESSGGKTTFTFELPIA